MYEFTHGGWSLNWGVLDRPSKWLCGGSMATMMVGLAPLLLPDFVMGYRIGRLLPHGGAHHSAMPELSGWMLVWIVGFVATSLWLWWRLSRRQDELFNRVQNWAIGVAALWTVALLALWGMGTLAGLVGPIPALAPPMLCVVLTAVLFPVAVRKWAS